MLSKLKYGLSVLQFPSEILKAPEIIMTYLSAVGPGPFSVAQLALISSHKTFLFFCANKVSPTRIYIFLAEGSSTQSSDSLKGADKTSRLMKSLELPFPEDKGDLT